MSGSLGAVTVVAGRKVKMTLPNGRVVDGTEIAVKESLERWTEVEFEDGLKLRVKMTVSSANRADSEYDPQGNPMVALNMTPVIVVMEVPEDMKKKVQ